MYKASYFGYFLVFMLLFGCNSCNESKDISYDPDLVKKQLEQSNKRNALREKKEIHDYIKKNNLVTTSTGTGLEYHLREQGQGPTGKLDQMATIHYSIYLLNDTLLYTSLDRDPPRFKIGQAPVETGLHEAVQLLRVGDKAALFLPSHLAHGAFGDQKKVPPQTPLRYEIELIRLE
ncbi:MAG: FKBP-type peptidyl-prolyl cis-trans isomerase [Bacteroidota bacterium]